MKRHGYGRWEGGKQVVTRVDRLHKDRSDRLCNFARSQASVVIRYSCSEFRLR